VTIDIEIEHRSSFSADLAISSLTYTKLGGAAVALGTGSLTVEFTYSEPGVFGEYSTYAMVLTLQDNAGVVIGSAPVTGGVLISGYTPMHSIREKGVGINCVNDGTDEYIEKVRGKINSVADIDGNIGYYENGVKITPLLSYPVGAIYLSVLNTSPATLFGGTWAAIGAGKMLIGVDAGDTDFNAAEKTGGEKTHTLTTTEMPAHTHTQQKKHSTALGSYDPSAPWINNTGTVYNWESGSAGGGGAHNNMPPYLAVYMWKRTA
jgi:hypothetical protein